MSMYIVSPFSRPEYIADRVLSGGRNILGLVEFIIVVNSNEETEGYACTTEPGQSSQCKILVITLDRSQQEKTANWLCISITSNYCSGIRAIRLLHLFITQWLLGTRRCDTSVPGWDPGLMHDRNTDPVAREEDH